LLATGLLWLVVAPIYAHGLALVGQALSPVLEPGREARYVVDGTRVLVQRPTWLPKQKRMAPLKWPVWSAQADYGTPVLAALILATPGWTWRRRGRALVMGLALLALTQVASLIVTILASQQSPVMSPDGMLPPAHYSPVKQAIFYALYYFFETMGHGFFALLIFLGLIAFGWSSQEGVAEVAMAQRVGRNDPCPCGSGRKYKRCCAT
jgi:hypothetical protein